VALFVATLASTTFIGGLYWGRFPEGVADLGLLELVTSWPFIREGLAFSVPLLFILLCHEMGHYLAARRHGLLTTPPYFIPFPVPLFGIGTLGAVIRVKEPIRNKRQLLDVGAAGPLAGFVALLPILAYGIAASEATTQLPEGGYLLFGEPLVYRALEWLLRPDVHGEVGLMLHPAGVAAWFGILVTLLNLLPFAQLDGGHICYALFGRWHRRAAWPLVAALAALGFVWVGWWLWMVIAVVLGPRHPRLWDEDRPLDRRRRLIGWLALLVFVLCFMAEPIALVM
jgi:membrane-associated protease RseP (regulator of RpoE activity)